MNTVTTVTNRNVGQANFFHLVADVAWFGLALAASTRFLNMYAIRLGATPFELGLLTSLPGLSLLVATMLSGWWRKKFKTTLGALFLPGLIFRLIFFLPVFAPLFPSHLQIVWLIASITVPAIPQAVAGVIFLVMMRESVSHDSWNRLNGYRTLAMNLGIALGAVGCGLLLNTVAFPTNYQLMFILAFAFTIVSFFHVMRVKTPYPATIAAVVNGAAVNSAVVNGASSAQETEMAQPKTRLWLTPGFQTAAFVTLLAHLAFQSVNSLLTLYVERMGADEAFLSVSGLVELMAGASVALFADRIINRVGIRTFITISVAGLALAAFALVAAPTLNMTLIASALTGASWSMTIIGAIGFFYERIPQEHLHTGTMAYQQVVSVAQFIGPMIGAALATSGISLAMVLFIGGTLRLSAAILIQLDLFEPVRGRGLLAWRGRSS